MKNIFIFSSAIILMVSACSNPSNRNQQKDLAFTDSISVDTLPELKDTSIYFRATGTEPFWGLEISEKQMVLDLIEDSLITSTPAPLATDENIKLYHIAEKGILLNVTISKTECADGMSGKISPYRVDVEYQRKSDQKPRALNGCGKYLSE